MTSSSQDIVRRFNPRVWDGPGQTVVFGHGVGTDQTAWQQQIEVLCAAGYRVVAFDFAGATPASAAHYSPLHHKTLYGFAEDLLVLLHTLELTGATYVGHSVGGLIGILAAVAEPRRFQALVTLGTSARYLDDPASGYVGGFSREQVEGMLQAAADNYTSWANGFAPHIVGDQNPYLSSTEFSQRLLALRPDIVHATLSALMLSDHRGDVEQLTTPLSVLQTRQDYAVPWSAAQWLADHGQARHLIEIAANGHLPHITAPEEVNQALMHCLAKA